MTDAKFNELIIIKKKIEDYEDMLKQLNDNQYEHFFIEGKCSDGVTDYIDVIPDDCLKTMKQWYIDEIMKLKDEFAKA